MAVTSPDSDLVLEERRELTMHGQALLEALLEFDRVNNGWLWRATEHRLSINTEASPPVVVEAKRNDGDELARAEFSIGHVAATFIHMCRTLRIPMPRNSRKEVKITAEGATLILHLSAPIQRRHTHSAAVPAAKPKAPRPAATEAGEDSSAEADAAAAGTAGDSGAAAEPGAEAVTPESAAEAPAAEPETPAPAAAAG
jgi:hypothetical protein